MGRMGEKKRSHEEWSAGCVENGAKYIVLRAGRLESGGGKMGIQVVDCIS